MMYKVLLVALSLMAVVSAITNEENMKKRLPLLEKMFRTCWKPEVEEDMKKCLPEGADKMTKEQKKAAIESMTSEQIHAGAMVMVECHLKQHGILNEDKTVNNEKNKEYIGKYCKEEKKEAMLKICDECKDSNKDHVEYNKCFEPKYSDLCKE